MGLPTSSTSPPPNHAQRGIKGKYWLGQYQIDLDPRDNIWKYTRSGKPIPKSEFWIPQRPNRPPDNTFLFNNQYYWEGAEVFYNEGLTCWVAKDSKTNSTHPFPNQFFQKVHWTPGTEKDLPTHLRLIVTPKAATTSLGTFQAPKESDSEQESEDSLEYKEFSDPQQLELTSTTGVPLELSPLILTQELSKQIEEDPFKSTDTELIIIDPPSPPREPTPPPPPPFITTTMANELKGVKFNIKKFTGKKEEANEFCTNLNLYFKIFPRNLLITLPVLPSP